MPLLEINNIPLVESLSDTFKGIKRGLEKESLRIRPDAYLSQRKHPSALGSALTNPHITTDYSEALPEFITSATSERLTPLKELTELHQFAYQNLGDELLWSASMPCAMGDEEDIPIARYGSSNSAKMKEVYRTGLGLRYGRLMQTIAGVHYNFSLPNSFWKALYEQQDSSLSLQDFISERYMAIIRNYLRCSWIIPLFFGASPALCESFLKGKNVELEPLFPGTSYGRYATSLRMSDLGYQNKAQSRLHVSYNSLEEYLQGLEQAMSTPDPFYLQLGVHKNGEYQQLNANILQIENEFYGSIRPKRVAVSGERPSKSLRNAGVEYLEVRALDINPFSPVGMTQSQVSFIDAFLLACLFADSPPLNERETGEFQENFRAVVTKGRHPDLCLIAQNRCVPMKQLATNLLNQIRKFSTVLDSVYKTQEHCAIIDQLTVQLDDLDTTYSGQMITAIRQRQDSFCAFVMDISRQHKNTLLSQPLTEGTRELLEKDALISHQKTRQIEQDDKISFEDYLTNYYR